LKDPEDEPAMNPQRREVLKVIGVGQGGKRGRLGPGRVGSGVGSGEERRGQMREFPLQPSSDEMQEYRVIEIESVSKSITGDVRTS
jgi:hypothetical protein